MFNEALKFTHIPGSCLTALVYVTNRANAEQTPQYQKRKEIEWEILGREKTGNGSAHCLALEELEELQKVAKIVTKQGLEHVWLEFSQY